MSTVQIPGLGTLLPATQVDSAQSSSVADGQVVTKESQPTSISHTNLSQAVEFDAVEDQMAVDHPPSPPSLTSGLEALLGGLDPLPEATPISSDSLKGAGGAPTEIIGAASSEPNDVAQVGEVLEGHNATPKKSTRSGK